MPVPFVSEGIAIGRIVWSALSGSWKFWRGRKRRLTPQQKLELRMKWKPEIEERLVYKRKNQHDGDVIIRDMRRIDHYPDVREGKGISAWFKVGLIYTYERGIMVGLRAIFRFSTLDDQHGRFTPAVRPVQLIAKAECGEVLHLTAIALVA